MSDELNNMVKFRKGVSDILAQHLYEFNTADRRNMINMQFKQLCAHHNILNSYVHITTLTNSSYILSEIDNIIQILKRDTKINKLLK